MNVMMLLEMAAGGFGDRVALGSRDGSGMTYAELFRCAGAAATHFGETDTDRVALIDISSPALPVALFGAAWAGKPFVPLNYRLTAEELLADTGVRIVALRLWETPNGSAEWRAGG